VVATSIEPPVEALVRAGDLDPPVEQRWGVAFRVRRNGSQQRHAGGRPEVDELRKKLCHPRVTGAAVVMRHAIVEHEDALERLRVTERQLDTRIVRRRKKRSTGQQTFAPALRENPAVRGHERLRSPARAAADVDHA
jgi:hypothetical protein